MSLADRLDEIHGEQFGYELEEKTSQTPAGEVLERHSGGRYSFREDSEAVREVIDKYSEW